MKIRINEHPKEVVSSSECSLNQKSLWSLSGTEDTMVTVSLDNLCKKTFGIQEQGHSSGANQILEQPNHLESLLQGPSQQDGDVVTTKTRF